MADVDSYVGEIRMFGGNYAPDGWALCDGSLLQVANNEALFSLLGSTYGGDGRSTFGLPDLRGRLPVGQGQGTGLSNRVLAQAIGAETVALAAAEVAPHSHPVGAGTAATASGLCLGSQYGDGGQSGSARRSRRACQPRQPPALSGDQLLHLRRRYLPRQTGLAV